MWSLSIRLLLLLQGVIIVADAQQAFHRLVHWPGWSTCPAVPLGIVDTFNELSAHELPALRPVGASAVRRQHLHANQEVRL
jgi:hypothetical protein